MNIYDNILTKLKSRIIQLDSLDEWLFVTVNTMRAIIDNSCKEDVSVVLKATELDSTDQIQQLYDTIQGRYGRDGFSYRNAPSYYYLSSLVARFPKTQLSGGDHDKIREYYEHDIFLLYEV